MSEKKKAKKKKEKGDRPIGIRQESLPRRILERERPWRYRVGYNPFLREEETDAASNQPPEGSGHFDRYYFSNCAVECVVENVVAMFLDAGQQVVYDGAIADGEIAEANWLGEPFSSLQADLTALVHWDGRELTYTATFDIPPGNMESIACISAGVCLFQQEENGVIVESLGAFGSAISHLGTWYPAVSVSLF